LERLVSDVKQIEIHTTELLVPDPSPFKIKSICRKNYWRSSVWVSINRSSTEQTFFFFFFFYSPDTGGGGSTSETIHQLIIDSKKAFDSVRREVLYNILTEIGIPMKLSRLVKSVVNMGKELYSKLPNQIKNIVDFTAFKKYLKSSLLKHSFHTIN
jgi:hypothetical protein